MPCYKILTRYRLEPGEVKRWQVNYWSRFMHIKTHNYLTNTLEEEAVVKKEE